MRTPTIHLEDAPLVAQEKHPGDQYLVTLHAPLCAAGAEPGGFAHIQCDPALPMRRPFSFLGADPERGEVTFLYKIVGEGTRLLARHQAGDSVNILGPIGQPFRTDPARPRRVLVGGGVGIPPVLFLAERLGPEAQAPLVLMGSEVPFPFATRPSRMIVPGMPAAAIGALARLEDQGIPSRLASGQGLPGCHEGVVTDLLEAWLATFDPAGFSEVEVFACGPEPMLAACTRVARRYGVACQVALEEFMACAVGGCAGCTATVWTDDGPVMRRVCVDGPVFDAREVFPA